MEKTCSVVLLLGPPASGKTTLGEKLARQFGYVLFDVGTHMREHMPPEADADAFALHAVGQVLEREDKVILSGYPKWKNGLDHLKSCSAKLDMAIILSPFDADELAKRAAERHRKGERPEDDHSNFQMRLKTYAANAEGILGELINMSVRKCLINPMDTPTAVEEAAVFQWTIQMPFDPDEVIEKFLSLTACSSSNSTAHEALPSSFPASSSRSSEGKLPSPSESLRQRANAYCVAESSCQKAYASAASVASVRGRSTVPGSSEDARERRDPSEAEIEVSLCLLSGEELLRPCVPARSAAKTLKAALINAGETDVDLDLLHMGQLLDDNDLVSEFNGFESGAVINVVRKKKPPPPPRPASRPTWDGNRHCISGRCFTPDSVVRMLEGGVEVQRCFKQVRVGDMVRTGPGEGLGFFRRVQRVWEHPLDAWEEPLAAYELTEGCRVTIGHPALVNGIWCRPESICDIASFETTTYQLEIEGHIDTVLVGSSKGVVCALLGRYCGEDFGWNIFTRKTVCCDKQPCKKCTKACLPGLTFDHTKLTQQMLEARYDPY